MFKRAPRNRSQFEGPPKKKLSAKKRAASEGRSNFQSAIALTTEDELTEESLLPIKRRDTRMIKGQEKTLNVAATKSGFAQEKGA